MTNDTIAEVMELVITLHDTAFDAMADNTVENAARKAVVNNCVGLIADMMKQEMEANDDGLQHVRWEDLDHSHDEEYGAIGNA